jgi:hypothetical protein
VGRQDVSPRLIRCPRGQLAQGGGLGDPPLGGDSGDLDGAGEAGGAQPLHHLLDLLRGVLQPAGVARGEQELLLGELERQQLEQFAFPPQ